MSTEIKVKVNGVEAHPTLADFGDKFSNLAGAAKEIGRVVGEGLQQMIAASTVAKNTLEAFKWQKFK